MIIETYIIDYLQKKTGVSCYAQYDDASQDTFIVVEKTGVYTDNFIGMQLLRYSRTVLRFMKLPFLMRR